MTVRRIRSHTAETKHRTGISEIGRGLEVTIVEVGEAGFVAIEAAPEPDARVSILLQQLTFHSC